MLMHKNLYVNNNCKNSNNDNNTRPFKAVVIHVADHKTKQNEHSTNNQTHRSLISDVTDNDNDVAPPIQSTNYEGFIERPVKLPLRKYHSFHFQPTQTVSGQPVSKLQQLQQQLLQQTNDLQDSSSEISSISQPYAKQGPLVFRPYKLDENVSFKPIQPSEESEDSIDYVREYVGTVEKFLKDEEKYMDSGDFTNLTQRLRQQQDFLNSTNSSEKEDLKENSYNAPQQQSDSEPNSLYEDINFKPKSLTLEQREPKNLTLKQRESFNSPGSNLKETRVDTLIDKAQKPRESFKEHKQESFRNEAQEKESLIEKRLDGFSEVAQNPSDSPKFVKSSFKENTPESSKEASDKSQHFISSSRALSLLKTVLESDSNPSEEEKSPEHQKASKNLPQSYAFSRSASNSSDLRSNTSSLSSSKQRAESFKDRSEIFKERSESLKDTVVSFQAPKAQNRVNDDIYSEVTRHSSMPCKRSESQKSFKSPKPSSLSQMHEDSLNNDNYKVMERIPSVRQDSQDSQNSLKSPKISTISRCLQESLDSAYYTDMNRNPLNSGEFDKSPISSKISTLSEQLSNRDYQDNYYETIYSPKHSSAERNSQIKENSKSLRDENKNPQNSQDFLKQTQIFTLTKDNAQNFNSSLQTPKVSKLSQDSLNNNSPRDLKTKAFSPLNSNLSRKSSVNYVSTKDETNNAKRSQSLLARKSLQFPSESLETPKASHIPAAGILTEKDLEKVFKPYEQQKSIQISNDSEIKERPVSTILNPAASLEALELLTKSNPELWSSNQAGSRHNLHQLELFHSLQKQNKASSKEEDIEEDLGYSFCEEENDDLEEEQEQLPPASPFVNVIMAPNSPSQSQVKYVLTQNHGEVHI